MDYSTQYLTFELIDSGTVSETTGINTIYYSIDSGSTWSALPTSTLPAGTKVWVKSSGSNILNRPLLGMGSFSVSGRFNLSGNIMSLKYEDDFIGKTTIDDTQFATLFRNCTNLVSAENLILPATTLRTSCYNQMFYGCTSLTIAPELPAPTLTTTCYNYMFYGCSSLNYIKCLATNISATNCTYEWVNGVSATGTFKKDSSMSSWTSGTSGIPSGWTISNYSSEPDYPEGYLTFTALESGTFSFSYCDIEYNIGFGWVTLPANTASPTIAAGGKIAFRRTATIAGGTFSSTGRFNVSGNAMSLLYGDNFANQTDLTGRDRAFDRLFYGCSNLVSAEDLLLPATILSEQCYSEMFRYCTSLTTSPVLPAPETARWCYYYMFESCSSLNYIKCLLLRDYASNSTWTWVDGVASTGTFVCIHLGDGYRRFYYYGEDGQNYPHGIPYGWTIVEMFYILPKTKTLYNTPGYNTFTISAYNNQGTVGYSSSNTAVATVNSSGVVTYVGNGTTTITAVDNYDSYSLPCTVTAETDAVDTLVISIPNMSNNEVTIDYNTSTSMTVAVSYLSGATTDVTSSVTITMNPTGIVTIS